MTDVKQKLNPETCAACADTGWRPVGDRVTRCECRIRGALDLRMRAARIPERYMQCEFDTFVPQPDAHALQTKARIDAIAFARDFPVARFEGLLFTGTIGTGKTHLAVATLKDLIRRGFAGVFYEYRTLLKEVQESYDKDSQCSELSVLRPLFDTPILVLDELGAVKPTEWVWDTVSLILNTRYNENRSTILTTNYPNASAGTMREQTLGDRITDRMHSRLNEMCKVIELGGGDYRRKQTL
jgi:DNA replication protein DnaC